jgi:hypothetical protein
LHQNKRVRRDWATRAALFSSHFKINARVYQIVRVVFVYLS